MPPDPLRPPVVRRWRRNGLTRVEIVVVAAIVLAALLILAPVLLSLRTASRRAYCQQRQQRVAAAILEFDKNKGHYPGYRNPGLSAAGEGPPPAASWIDVLRPILADETPTAALERGDDSAAGPAFVPVRCPATPPRVFQARPAATSLVAAAGLPDAPPSDEFPPDWPANGVFHDLAAEKGPSPIVTSQYVAEHDGLARTILFSENADAGDWTATAEHRVGFVWVAELVDGRPDPGGALWPINVRGGQGDGSPRFARPSSYHGGGVNVAYCSGAVEFLSDQIDYLLFTRLLTPDGGGLKRPGGKEPLPAPYRTE
jgi:type II secretory pathway pseudopilin PulG